MTTYRLILDTGYEHEFEADDDMDFEQVAAVLADPGYNEVLPPGWAEVEGFIFDTSRLVGLVLVPPLAPVVPPRPRRNPSAAGS